MVLILASNTPMFEPRSIVCVKVKDVRRIPIIDQDSHEHCYCQSLQLLLVHHDGDDGHIQHLIQ